MEDNDLVSIIVPTNNSEATLEKCLNSIRSQTYPNIEIIVVDNYSKDQTRLIAERLRAKVYFKGSERTQQVNFGAQKALGKYVYRVDSDFILETSVVEEAVSESERGYDAIVIHNVSDPTVSFWSRVRKLERECYREDELSVGARFTKKSVFEAVGGFDTNLIAAEDYDFHNRLLEKGFKIGRIRACEIHIGEPKSIGEVIRKHYYYGKTLKRFIDRNPNRGISQLSPLKIAFIRNRKRFASYPLLTCGFVLYQTVRYMAAGFGFISSLEGQ